MFSIESLRTWLSYRQRSCCTFQKKILDTEHFQSCNNPRLSLLGFFSLVKVHPFSNFQGGIQALYSQLFQTSQERLKNFLTFLNGKILSQEKSSASSE